MANPLQSSILAADRANLHLLKLFSKAGIDGHPRGSVVTAYRVARRGLRAAFDEPNPSQSSREVLDVLRMSIQSSVTDIFMQSQTYGQDTAVKMLSYYDVEPENSDFMGLLSKVQTAVGVIMANVDAQATTIKGMLISGVDAEVIVGDEDRAGVLKPGTVLGALAYWSAQLMWDAWTQQVTMTSAKTRRPFKKQAVATMDERVTDCCLRVHGQVVGLDEPFKLVGTPRYADELQGPPFHHYCRTATALYLPEFDDGLTQIMQASADEILNERAAGINKVRHPANAIS